jgi:hypothetical protein
MVLYATSTPEEKGKVMVKLVSGFVTALLLVAGATWNVIDDNTMRYRTLTVCGAERTAKSGGGAEYRLQTAHNETFAMADSWLKRRTNTADDYSRMKNQGFPTTYRVGVVHRRFSPFSWMPNVIKFEKIPTNQAEAALCGQTA